MSHHIDNIGGNWTAEPRGDDATFRLTYLGPLDLTRTRRKHNLLHRTLKFEEAMEIGILRDIRLARGDTLSGGAEEIKTSKENLSRWETGRVMPTNNLREAVLSYMVQSHAAPHVLGAMNPETTAFVASQCSVMDVPPEVVLTSLVNGSDAVVNQTEDPDFPNSYMAQLAGILENRGYSEDQIQRRCELVRDEANEHEERHSV